MTDWWPILDSRNATIESPAKNIATICALSPMQEGLLFHALLAPDSAVYFEQVSCRLDNLTQPRHFRQAWQMVVDRHAALRTCFYWKNRKRPLQIVRRQCDLPWVEEDWGNLVPAERRERLEVLLQADRSQGFDLGTAPLMRCTLIHLAGHGYQFIWSHHHLVLDGWSAALVVKEVFAIYETLCAGGNPWLPAPRAFQDYIDWIGRRHSADDEAFWRKNLHGFLEPTRIGSKVSRVMDEPETAYEEREVYLSEAATSALQDLTRKHRLTLNCLVQAAWAILLSRLCGERDVVFGSTVSGRPPELPGVETMVGVFINALPVRIGVPRTADLLPWLQQIMAEQVEREQHGYTSLVDIQGWSELRAGEPLFDSLIIFENYPLRESENTLGLTELCLFRRANYPLTLVVVPEARLHLAINFDTSHFTPDAIERILQHLALLLQQIAERPDRQLSEFTLLSDHEQKLLAQWNETSTLYRAERCAHELFADCAGKAPDAVAVVFGQECLTYRALDARTNQLARFLQERGVTRETLVGVCVQRSLEMVIAVLAILKAGGAYLPLDPTYPAERLQFMIEDAGVPIIVTEERLQNRIPSQWTQLILIDADWAEIDTQSEDALSSSVDANNLAYVIYTSGSTGTPKGVQVTHLGLSNLSTAQQSLFSPLAGGCVLQFASLSFDASVWEMVMGICSGATLHLGTAETLLPGPSLAEHLDRSEITHVTLPPSALDMLPECTLPDLRTLIVAGEACPAELIHRWAPNRQFVNAYGPTESTVCATAWTCATDELQSPPIGRPLPNTRAYPVDRDMNLVPIGFPGDLHVGGPNLARGYLHKAALTAERFVPDPFSGERGARLYDTGDLVRYRPDGSLLFLGRRDHQVKIRGHRIEMGEIEATLAQIPGVKQGVVVIRQNPGGDLLAAYIVAEPGLGREATFNPASLRRHVQERLPDYMVPSVFIQLDSLPLSPNGKVDRKALPEIETRSTSSGTRSYRPPRDILEQKLVGIWEEVLGVRPIGVEDDFFLLGGHSLLAVRLMAWIDQEFGQHLPMATLFKGPTIAQLALILRQKREVPAWSSLVAIQSAGTKKPVFFVPGGGGNVFYLYELAHRLGQDRPFYGLQARGLDGQSAPHDSIEEMAEAYLNEIIAVQPNGPYLLGGHSSGSWVAFEMARQLWKRGEEVAMVAVIDTPAPLPETKKSGVDEDDALYLTKVCRLIERWAGKDLDISYEALQPLTSLERMDYLQERLKTLDILPPQAGRAQVHGLIQVFQASTRNCTRYSTQEAYPGTVVLLRANDIHIEDTDIRINLRADDDTWGWNQLAGTSVDVHLVPGDHVTMMAEPHVGELASSLAACIRRAEEGRESHE